MPAFVDTNIWVYALTTADLPRQKKAEILLRSLQEPRINGQVLRELGRVLLQKHGIDETSFRRAVAAIDAGCQLVPDSASMIFRASQLRESQAFSYWDSLIVAAALEAGCDTLYSEDMQHGQVIDGRLTLVNPFATELGKP